MKTNLTYLGFGIILGIALSMIIYLAIKPNTIKQEFQHKNQLPEVEIKNERLEPLILDFTQSGNNMTGIIQPDKVIKYQEPTQKPKLNGSVEIWRSNGGTILDAWDSTYKGYHIYTSPNHPSLVIRGSGSHPMIEINMKAYDTLPSVDLDSTKNFLTLSRDNQKINYSKGFLANYPTSPKLLYTKITKDSIRFDLMQPNGVATSSTFRTNILGYNYETNDGKLLKFSKLEEAPPQRPNPFDGLNKTIHTESNLYMLYDPLQKVGRVRIDYSLMYNRTGLYFSNQLQSMFPVYQAEVGLRFKLK